MFWHTLKTTCIDANTLPTSAFDVGLWNYVIQSNKSKEFWYNICWCSLVEYASTSEYSSQLLCKSFLFSFFVICFISIVTCKLLVVVFTVFVELILVGRKHIVIRSIDGRYSMMFFYIIYLSAKGHFWEYIKLEKLWFSSFRIDYISCFQWMTCRLTWMHSYFSIKYLCHI